MADLNRRMFLASAAAATAARGLPAITAAVKAPPARRILTLVYDKSMGMMRAVERVVY